MCDKTDFERCRLCLSSGGLLINIFEQNNKLEFMLEKTIEDLIDVQVVEDSSYPWLVCSNCMEKLTEFRLFKRRCAECLFVFYNRIHKGCNPPTKDWITNGKEEESDVRIHDNKGVERSREESVEGTSGKVWAFSSPVERATVEMEGTYSVGCQLNWMADNNCNGVEIQGPGGVKEDFGDDAIASDTIVNKPVDVRDDMVIVKEEVDDASGCCAAPEKNIDWSVVPSIQERGSHWSDIEFSGNLNHSEDRDLQLPFNEEVDIKEEVDVEEDGGLSGDASQNGGQEQDGAGKDGVGNFSLGHQICNEGFAQKDIPLAHVMHAHPAKRNQLGFDVSSEPFQCKSDLDAYAKTYECEHCRREFSQRVTLKKHVLTHTDDERPHECEVCRKGFTLKRHLEVHLRVHTGGEEKSHRCERCAKAFRLKKQLKEHMLTHSDERPHKCETCAKTFKFKQKLKRHMLLHDGGRPHECEICSKGFHHKTHLNRHMLLHTGERPHKCEICAKEFTLKQHLKVHVLFHSGERPHKCEVCAKAFTLRQHLRDHVLIHSGEKAHECEVCAKAFAHKKQLKEHRLIHIGARPHECEVCAKAFTCKQNLVRHMLLHSGERPHKCRTCAKEFSQKHNLMRHMLLHDGGRPQ